MLRIGGTALKDLYKKLQAKLDEKQKLSEHYVLRAIEKQDLAAFSELAHQAGAGMTTLPKDDKLLAEKLDKAALSFEGKAEQPDYLFVLENQESKEICGVSGIRAKLGSHHPMVLYRIEKENVSTGKTITKLEPFSIRDGPSEICTLYLAKNQRKAGLAPLLILARYLYIAKEPQRFTKRLCSNLRGYSEKDSCLFWDYVHKPLTGLSFKEASELYAKDECALMTLLKQNTLYLERFPQILQDSLGLCHPNTEPAARWLEQEGFSFDQEIHILDGGPKLSVESQDARSVRDSQVYQIEALEDSISAPLQLVSREEGSFRAAYAAIKIEGHTCRLTKAKAKLLQVEKASKIRLISAYP